MRKLELTPEDSQRFPATENSYIYIYPKILIYYYNYY
jgi:hypothetical protein